MKNKIGYLLFTIILCIPFIVFAISDDYEDLVHDIVDVPVEGGKINLYLFHSADCSHCAQEIKWLNSNIKDEYKDYLNIYMFEVTYNEDNDKLMELAADRLGVSSESVPLTIIGSKTYVGYSDATASRIETQIKKYAEFDADDTVKIPILGNINMRDVSIPVVAVVLGFIDGFNPCAMWILLFLINMFFGMKDRKKAWILGMVFLLVSGLVYFLSMLGINFVIGIATINWMKKIIALFILGAGIFNFRKYLKTRKEEAGCTVVDAKKRRKLTSKIKKIMNSKTFLLSLLGIITLAVSVNLIELACSLGFPLIFTEILSINNIKGVLRIIYLIIYIFFYMIDDMVVFGVSMITVEATGITNKYNKLCTLVSAVIMIIIGLLLLFKPSWLMLNF